MNRDPGPHHPLVQRLSDARQVTDALFSIVKPEFLYERPIRERHRIVFYIGHLEAFDRNLFDKRLFDLPAFDEQLDQLHAILGNIKLTALEQMASKGTYSGQRFSPIFPQIRWPG